MRRILSVPALLVLALALTVPAVAAEKALGAKTLITNARVFDGKSDKLTEPVFPRLQ